MPRLPHVFTHGTALNVPVEVRKVPSIRGEFAYVVLFGEKVGPGFEVYMDEGTADDLYAGLAAAEVES